MRRPKHQAERRKAPRPVNEDAKPCPRCARGICEFNERYRFSGTTLPGWLCDSCGYRELARSEPSRPEDVRVAAREVEANPERTMLKARAEKLIAASKRRTG
jgi:hypothetical protein